MMKTITLKELRTKNNNLKQINLNGYHYKKMFENLYEKMGNEAAEHIFYNSKKILPYFADPLGEPSTSKIIALGKVQSGKTAFFISALSLAFDNNYKLAIVFGGTKTTLLEQNLERIEQEFQNNQRIKIVDYKNESTEDIKKYIKDGFFVILVVLKNVSSEKTNLYYIEEISKKMSDIPTVIIDDESDEHTPGAPKLKKKNPRVGTTHDVISNIIKIFSYVTVVFVTATPQANLLLSKLDYLSPDYISLVEPGLGYTGGDAFHDSVNNENVIEIYDSDDFRYSLPISFQDSIKYFMLASAIRYTISDYDEYSMLVHPSHLKNIHSNVVEKIEEEIISLQSVLTNKFNVVHSEYKKDFKKQFINSFYQYKELSFDDVFDNLINLMEKFKVYKYNTSEVARNSIAESNDDEDIKYKIFVGGNMLGRGVTIKNLIVTYIYRDSKISAVDTLYQRARWFGYKAKYFDICRVYMTQNLKEKFIALVDNERDMWSSIREFLKTDIYLKDFKRIFTLSNDSLILTRKSVSKTVTFERIRGGYNYDTTLRFHPGDIEFNNELVKDFVFQFEKKSRTINFAKGDSQQHLVISTKYSDVFNSFISKYKFQRNSKLGILTFTKINNQVLGGEIEDQIDVVIMRFRDYQYRALNPHGYSIKELPQGYNLSSDYLGDKNLIIDNQNKMQLQVHLVYTDKETREIIPLLAFKNPLTEHSIRYVTGDDYYDEL